MNRQVSRRRDRHCDGPYLHSPNERRQQLSTFSSFQWRLVVIGAVSLLLWINAGRTRGEDAPATFYRGLNLNGPAMVIDGQQWDGSDAKNYVCKDKAFENQSVTLVPATDAERARMIRSSRWGGNDVSLTGIPAGRYSVFLYLWEDNNAENFSIAVNGREVVRNYNSDSTGHWDKLGPWFVDVRDGTIRLTSRGGAANFSGIEIWRGEQHAKPLDLTADNIEFFEQRIRPLLIKHCYECHSAAAGEAEGDLLVDSRLGLREGGSRGPALVPGDPAQSLLLKAIRYQDQDLQMPPDQRLADADIAAFEQWIKRGAPDPRTQATQIAKRSIDLDAARTFWSFKPLVDPPVPVVKDTAWPRNDIDRFILAELERRELQPLANADKRTLIRRATFDLIGLPPTPAEIDAFLNDDSPGAFAAVVERLLASRQYGERWGRYWMDLVRYADTAGDNSDYPIPQAYLYRNYIIDAFNADKPYDRFIQEQIAGDLMPAENDAQRNEQIIATGYIAISRRFGSVIQDYPQHLTIEDTLDNLGRTVLGLTITCARCHEHKFDPISNADYYGLYGIFASTRYPFPGIELDKKPRDFVALWDGGKPGARMAYAVADDSPGDARIHLRGEPKRLGEEVPRHFLTILGGQTLDDQSRGQSGRLQLAQWLTDPRNPLTPRVIVNRIWQYHFGAGLVPTPSDFGARGQPPSHPNLLDWLATRLLEDGWSIKQLHRRIMHSRVYQLASAQAELTPRQSAARSLDPNNELHWRFTRRRLDAESLRDSLLLLSGELDDSMMTEPHPFPPAEKWGYTQHHPFRDSYASRRRSVYLMTARLTAESYFNMFDGADRNASTPKRDSSVTTIQALYLLNGEFVHRQADLFAVRLLRETSDPSARLQRAFELALGRPPANHERESAADWFHQCNEQLELSRIPADQREQQAWAAFARVLFRTNEFLYVD
jgi:hypothetical protein